MHVTVNTMISFPYDVTEDRTRFQKSVIDGDLGYYDTIARKFIPQETLDSLLENIIPEKEHLLVSENDPRLSQSLNRIRRNLSIYQRNPSDSYAQIFLKYLSNRYLSSIREQKLDAAILYVDVVGSTKLATQTFCIRVVITNSSIFSRDVNYNFKTWWLCTKICR